MTITIIDVDPDYLGIDMRAENDRFAGPAQIYAGLTDLGELADRIQGFPGSSADDRIYEFGSRERGFSGGYCRLRLHCVDSVGHARAEVTLRDDEQRHGPASAEFAFPVAAADVDEFTARLRELQRKQEGTAILQAAV